MFHVLLEPEGLPCRPKSEPNFNIILPSTLFPKCNVWKEKCNWSKFLFTAEFTNALLSLLFQPEDNGGNGTFAGNIVITGRVRAVCNLIAFILLCSFRAGSVSNDWKSHLNTGHQTIYNDTGNQILPYFNVHELSEWQQWDVSFRN
jgi:hypothetical protein